MASFNAELACKALEQRISGLERAIDSLRKSSQGNDAAGARMKGHDDKLKSHDDRVAKLESVVKVLGENRSASKVDAMEKSIKALHDAKLIDEKSFNKQLTENDSKREAVQRRDQEKATQQVKAMVDKQMADLQKQIDNNKLESRLQVLEAKVNAALAKV